MERTQLRNRILPDYSVGEEWFNCISHIVGGALGAAVLALCVAYSVYKQDPCAIICSAVYGVSMVLLYTMSSIYHGLRNQTAKKVFQILDHCTIYYLIGGTYTPILLCSIRQISPVWAWSLFGIVWGVCVMATVFTAIDLKKYAALSMICYIGMGWCIVAAGKIALEAIPAMGLLWLLAGGIAYTAGSVLYGMGRNHKYMHGAFHIFVLLGSFLQFLCIYGYVL